MTFNIDKSITQLVSYGLETCFGPESIFEAIDFVFWFRESLLNSYIEFFINVSMKKCITYINLIKGQFLAVVITIRLLIVVILLSTFLMLHQPWFSTIHLFAADSPFLVKSQQTSRFHRLGNNFHMHSFKPSRMVCYFFIWCRFPDGGYCGCKGLTTISRCSN